MRSPGAACASSELSCNRACAVLRACRSTPDATFRATGRPGTGCLCRWARSPSANICARRPAARSYRQDARHARRSGLVAARALASGSELGRLLGAGGFIRTRSPRRPSRRARGRATPTGCGARGYDSADPWTDYVIGAVDERGTVVSGWDMRNARLPSRVAEAAFRDGLHHRPRARIHPCAR